MLRFTLLLCLSCFIFFDAHGQCTVRDLTGGITQGNLTAGNFVGQTFTACQTGVITSISVSVGDQFLGTDAGTHNLRIGPSTNPPTALIGGPVYQTFSTSGGAENITIFLNQPFPVTNGMVYAFDIETGSNYEYNTTSPGDYPGGIVYTYAVFFFPDSTVDIDFGVEIQPNPVPALGEWGILLLGMCLLIFGTLTLKQRNLTIISN